ncbi:MAG: orc1/cdc6 family replication initiation protein [Candidatus Thermoplasmatota archaeon]|nr:orc1/cdc6 family replication initiation protein [Candidatus Thermoplasmatota archaeon]
MRDQYVIERRGEESTGQGQQGNSRTITERLSQVGDLFDQFLSARQLFVDREVLSSTYVPSLLLHRDQEQQELAVMLLPALRNQTPNNIYLFGPPGTGKSAATQLVTSQLAQKGHAQGQQIMVVWCNCQRVDTEYRVLQHIGMRFVDETSGQTQFSGLSTDELYSRVLRLLDAQPCVTVVVLDEVDRLKSDTTLYTLSRINSELRQSKLSVVCITNNLRFEEFVDMRVKSSFSKEHLSFSSYDATQLQDILADRVAQALKPGVLSSDVIPLCAALAAAEHGDARRALDLLRVATELAERKGEPRATVQHVRLAQKKIETDCLAEVVRGLPMHAKLTLFAIWKAQMQLRSRDGGTSLMTGEVYQCYLEVCRRVSYRSLTQRRVADFITELDMQGIISAREISKGRQGHTRDISISSSCLHLINVLMEDELFKELGQFKMGSQTRLV